MKEIQCAIIFIAALSITTDASAKIGRSHKVLREFMQQQACPATGKHRLPCPGYHIDHITPLCAGGADAVENLQWLTREAHKEKTRKDLGHCATLRRQ